MSSRRSRHQTAPQPGVFPLAGPGNSPLAAHGRSTPEHRKTLQLCRQVERALSYALSESPDGLLRDLMIVEVEPAPNARRLLVTATPLDGDLDPLLVTTRMQAAVGWLRTQIAASINRRKVPELLVRCVPPVGQGKP